MTADRSRRTVLKQAAVLAAVGSASDLEFLGRLRPVSAGEAKLDPNVVRLNRDIEPLVELLEDTPREELIQKVAQRIHGGLSYQELLAALLLAAVRNIEPRPSVGFKFHGVLVINSAHLASLASPDEHRWLPMFWALEYFKKTQSDQQRQHPWRMAPVRESAVPSADKAHRAFADAMDRWDEGAADAAAASLARHAGEQDIFELLFRYGARDFRDIGHKAIFVSNSRRTLDTVGWRYAEPVLRSLAFALLQHEGDNPAKRDGEPDRPGRKNLERANRFKPGWAGGRIDDKATRELLEVLRQGSADDASEKVVELSNAGIAPQSIWDALFLGSGELLVRRRGIVAVHAVTTTNALHYAFLTSGDDNTRRWLMLQDASFIPLFRQAIVGRGEKLDKLTVEDLVPENAGSPTDALGDIVATINQNRQLAAGKLLGYLDAHSPQPFVDAARVLIFLKGSEPHDYKFSSAAFEDYLHVSPAWRNRYLATSVYRLLGSNSPDNGLEARVKASLA